MIKRGALLTLFLATIPAQATDYKHQVRQIFNTEPLNEKYISVYGKWAGVVTQKNDGLHMQFPDGLKKPESLGVLLKQFIHGDFEITLTYETKTTNPPKSGYGAGVVVYVMINDGKGTFAAISCRTLTSGKIEFNTSRGWFPNGKLSQKLEPTQAKSREGRMQLIREGTTVKYLVQEPGDKSFRLLRLEKDFGSAPVKLCKIAANRGFSNEPLYTIFRDVTIRADTLSPELMSVTKDQESEELAPLPDIETSVAHNERRSHVPFLLTICAIVIIVVVLLVGWLWVRRRQGEDEDEDEDDSD